METVPPLPAESQHGGEVSIILKEGVTLQQVAGGTLRMVVKDAAGVYHDCAFAMSGGGVSVRYFEGAQAVEVGVIGHFDGTRRELTLTTTQGDLTIEAVLLASAMADVVMFPEVLTDQTENALLLFKTSIVEQALVDGALELQFANQRYGEKYIYPEVYNREGDAHFLDIRDADGGNSLFRSVYFEGTRFESLQLEKQVWTDPTLKISSPNRLMWQDGLVLLPTHNAAVFDGHSFMRGSLGAESCAFCNKNSSEIISYFRRSSGDQLRYSGGLSKTTVFESFSADIGMPVIAVEVRSRKDITGVDDVPILFPLYAYRLQSNGLLPPTSWLITKNGDSSASVWGAPAPVSITSE